jgi:hypothetical protein
MKNPQHNTFILPEGYKDLGFTNGGSIPEVNECHEAGHTLERFNNSLYLHGGDDNIYICHTCKHVFHVDSSD